jgi:hypothetical protein
MKPKWMWMDSMAQLASINIPLQSKFTVLNFINDELDLPQGSYYNMYYVNVVLIDEKKKGE